MEDVHAQGEKRTLLSHLHQHMTALNKNCLKAVSNVKEACSDPRRKITLCVLFIFA